MQVQVPVDTYLFDLHDMTGLDGGNLLIHRAGAR